MMSMNDLLRVKSDLFPDLGLVLDVFLCVWFYLLSLAKDFFFGKFFIFETAFIG